MDKKKVEELIEQIQKYCDQAYSPNWQPKSFEEFVKLGNICREVIKELSKSDWVSVEDGLPEYGENVLAISIDGYMNVSYRRKIPRDKISREVMDDNGFILNFNLRCSTITHWKPIEKLEE